MCIKWKRGKRSKRDGQKERSEAISPNIVTVPGPISAEAEEVIQHYWKTKAKRALDDPKTYQAAVERCAKQQKEPYFPPDFLFDYVDVDSTITPTTHMNYYVLKPKGGVETDMTILYFHGGAFMYQLWDATWNIVIRMVNRFRCTVVVPVYPLAPTYNYQQTTSAILDLYHHFLNKRKSSSLVLAGDSSGAYLCRVLSAYCQQQEMFQPGAILYLSPIIDLACTAPGVEEIAPLDPMLGSSINPALIWVGEDADLSAFPPNAYHASFQGHPPFFCVTSTIDLLSCDALRFVEEAAAAGIPHECFVYEGLPHAFVQWSIPETEDLFTRIEGFLQQRGFIG